MTAPRIDVKRWDRQASITLKAPPLNILDLAMIGELRRCLEELSSDTDLQLLILQGEGESAFSAGVAVEDHTADKVPSMLREFHGAIRQLGDLGAVTVAVVRGHCLGGGMELAAACDLILAGDESRFGQPEIKLGCFPPLAAALYPSLIGRQRTAELLLTGRTITAREAVEIGFVWRCLPRKTLDSAVDALARDVLAQSNAVIRLTKRAIRAGCDRPFAEALRESERIYLEELAETRDMDEGLTAFLEKRPPNWHHR